MYSQLCCLGPSGFNKHRMGSKIRICKSLRLAATMLDLFTIARQKRTKGYYRLLIFFSDLSVTDHQHTRKKERSHHQHFLIVSSSWINSWNNIAHDFSASVTKLNPPRNKSFKNLQHFGELIPMAWSCHLRKNIVLGLAQ